MRGSPDEKEKCLEKLNEMHTFLPFLDFMIDKIKKKHILPLECQLNKFQHIRSLIIEKNGRYSLEGLANIEDVLRKLINKLDYKGLNTRIRKESKGVKAESTHPKGGDTKSNDESVTTHGSACTVTTSYSSAIPTNVSDSLTSPVDILIKSLRMSVGHNSRQDDKKKYAADTFIDSSTIACATNIANTETEYMVKTETEGYKKSTGCVCQESIATQRSSTASNVLADSRKKLMKSVSGKGLTTNNSESDCKTDVFSDSPKPKVDSVQDCKRANVCPDRSEEKRNCISSKNGILNDALSDISDDEYEVGEEINCNEKINNKSESDKFKGRKHSSDSCRSDGDSVNRAEFKYNDSFLNILSSSAVDFNSKQKLRERLSADIAEVHKVPGKSVGGSLRSLKDIKASSQESDSVKPEKTRESLSSDSKLSSRKRSDHCRSSHSSKYDRQKRSWMDKDQKSDRMGSSHDKRRERRKDEKHKTVMENKTGDSIKYSSSKRRRRRRRPSRSRDKKKRINKHSEIDKLNDQELTDFVKKNISSFPNLSKLKPDELRRVARISLSTEGSDERRSGAEVKEKTSGEGKLHNQDLIVKNTKGKTSNIDYCSSSGSDERKFQGAAESNALQEPYLKTLCNAVVNFGVGVEDEKCRVPVDEITCTANTRASSNQAELENNRSMPDSRVCEKSSGPEGRDQRLKHPVAHASDNSHSVKDTKIQNRAPRPKGSPIECQVTTRFPSLPSDRNTLDSRTRNLIVCTEKPYSNRTPFPVQGHNRYHTFDATSHDANNSIKKHGTVSEVVRFPMSKTSKNLNFNRSKSHPYGKYKQSRRHGREIMKKSRPVHGDVTNSLEKNAVEEVTGSGGPGGAEEEERGKDYCKSSAPSKMNDFKGDKARKANPLSPKSNSESRKPLEKDRGEKMEKSSGSKTSQDDELISSLKKLCDNNQKPITGRGYGLQNFKIPKKGRNTSTDNQKSQVDDKDLKNKQCISSQNRLSTENNNNKVSVKSEAENNTANRKADRAVSASKLSDTKIVTECRPAAKKVSLEQDTENSSVDNENSFADNNKGNGNKEKGARTRERQGSSSEMSKEDHVINNEPDNIEQIEGADGSLVKSVESSLDVKNKKPEVTQDSSSLPSSDVPHTQSGNLPESSAKDKNSVEDICREEKETGEKLKGDTDINSKALLTEEITQELVEALIRKSFESGEGELLLAKAKLFKELALKLNSKKLKTIQKIINSESDSSTSSSDSSVVGEKKKKKTKKKKNCDDMEEKSLSKEKSPKTKSPKNKHDADEENTENLDKPTVSSDANNSKTSNGEMEVAENEGDSPSKNSKTSNRKTKLLEQIFNESPTKNFDINMTDQSASEKESDQKAKIKPKPKGKTELDRLHEDIRNMFITSGVVTATGQRMCRMLRESGGKVNNLDLVKESAKMVEEEKLASRKCRRRNPAAKESKRSGSADRRTLRDRSKTNNQLQVEGEKPTSDETIKKADVDVSKVAAIGKDQPKVLLQRINLEKLSYAFKINGFPQSYARPRGMNVARRGRSIRSATRFDRAREMAINKEGKIYLTRNVRKAIALGDKTIKKSFKPKKLADIIRNLPLKMAKLRHLEIGSQQEESLHRNPKSVAEQDNVKGNISKNEEILNYAFERNKSIFPCLLCGRSTQNITAHYLADHPESEVLISRLAKPEAERAIRDSRANNYDLVALEQACTLEVIKRRFKSKLSGPPSFFCRMCNHGSSTTTCQFFSHVSTHTGEYRFKCPVGDCGLPMASRDHLKFHMSWKHPKSRYQANKLIELFPLPSDSGILFGYLCSHCNFVQLLKGNLENHILKEHVDVEDVRIIKIDMSSKQEESSRKEVGAKSKRRTRNGNDGNREYSDQSEDDGGSEDDVGDEDYVYNSDEAVSSNSNEDEDEGSESSSDIGYEEYRPGKTLRSGSEGKRSSTKKQKTKNMEAGLTDGSTVDMEKMKSEGTNRPNVFEQTTSSCVTCHEMDEDNTAKKGLAEEVSEKDTAEIADVVMIDDQTNSGEEKRWVVGPLEAVMFKNRKISFRCAVSCCRFSTEVFTVFENHISSTHGSESWNGDCKSCNDYSDGKVELLQGNVDIGKILSHMECHIKTDAGEHAADKIKNEDIIIEENQLEEIGEPNEIEAVKVKTTTNDVPYPVKPLLRVRSFAGDRLSKPKCVSDDDQSYSGSPNAIDETSNEDEKNTAEPCLFTIKDVRSLNPETSDDTSPDENVFTSQEITLKKFPPNAEVISGKPVLIRSCPSPKITIRPETNAIPIPVAQAKQAVEAGHLKVVPPPTDVSPIGLKQLEFVTTASIRILSPAAFTSQTVLVPTFTTSTRLMPISKPADTVVMNQNKNRTLNPVTNTSPPGHNLLIKDVKISQANKESCVAKKKKKKIMARPSALTPRPLLPAPALEFSPESNADIPKRQQLYSLSFGGKNIKDVNIYQEMLSKKKLCQLFKCMAVECSFTSNNDTIFTQHIGLHEAQQRIKGKKRPQNKVRKIFNWQQCAYCCEVLVHTGSALSQHILTEHGHCLYQCAYCFYRAVSEAYVDLHQLIVHENLLKEKKKLIYKCQPVPGAIMSKQFEKPIRPQNVKPYHCEICGNKFFIIKHFFDHLTKQHSSVTAYTCHICKILCFKADRLIAHYKLHSYSMFQCSYCLHGTETQKEMLFHLCNFHFSQPPLLYARMLEDAAKSDNIVLDDLKLITFENEPSDPACILEEADAEDELDTEEIQSIPISVDLSAIVSELGIDVEDGSKENSSSLAKMVKEMESDLSHSIPVESILPNAKFSSESDTVCEENSSVLISSELKTGKSKKDDKESSVPIGQLPIEVLQMETKEQSPAAKQLSDFNKEISLSEGLEKLQQNNCEITVSPVKEKDKKPLEEIPTRSMHKLPPTIPINRSGVNNVYQPRKNFTKKLESTPGKVKEGVSVLLKPLATGQRISSDCIPAKSVILAVPVVDSSSTAVKEESTLLPSIQNVVSLKRPGSNCELQDSLNNINDGNSVKRLRLSATPLNTLITLNTSGESPLMISDVRSLSAEKTTLQPPIIRVEDFANDEKGNLVRKSESASTETKKISEEPDVVAAPINDNSSNYPEAPLSPEVIIIDPEDTGKSLHSELIEVVDSEDDGETSKISDRKEEKKILTDDDMEIRKQMERLRNQIENETDCLLLDDTTQENDPLACSEKSESSKACFSTDGETMHSFNEDSVNMEMKNELSEKNGAEESKRENEDKASSNENSQDGLEDKMEKKTDTRIKSNYVKKNLKADYLKPQELSGKELFLCGSADCDYAAETSSDLKDHLYICDFSRASSVLFCPHCSRQFKYTTTYIDHLKIHGEKKFMCGLCAFCSAAESNVNRHLKQKHRCSQTRTLSNDSFKPGYYVVYPRNYKIDRPEVTNSYSPGDEDKLPLQSIYQENVKCTKCPYFTKVRSNMVRHLKIHIKSVEASGSIVVPSTAPTNPVPCLVTKEKMFDKMANLAASSQLAHANKDKLDTLSPEDEAKLPQFVPEQMRHKCCSPDCNYLTIDDNMLKHHIKALHDEINVYSCPHCRETAHVEFRFVPLDKIGQHLKYHDSKLYKCCHCIYFHHQKYIVEKHVLEKHPERRFFVHTVREPKVESASEEEHSSPSESVMKLWKCGLCDDFERTIRSSVVEHLSKVHNMKSKFKCKYCDMKSSQYSAFAQHFASKHNGQKVEYVRAIVQVNRSCPEGSQGMTGQDSSAEYFDTTPLWQRDAPRIRHIRGILIEEEEIKTRRTKRASCDIENEAIPPSTLPLGSFYCPLCTDKKKVFRSKSAESFRTHLYQELNYQQYACTLCGKMFVDRKDYERHHLRSHPNKPQSIKQTKEDGEIKFWVEKVVAKQQAQLNEKKRMASCSEDRVNQPTKKKKVQTEQDKEIDKEGDETKSCSDVKSETKSKRRNSGEKSNFVRLTRSVSAVQPVEGTRKSSDSGNSVKTDKITKMGKWLCHYCKESFQTDKEATRHCRSKHPNDPVKTMLKETRDGWLIQCGRESTKETENSSKETKDVPAEPPRSSVYSCGYCMIEVTDQSSIVEHFEKHHKAGHGLQQGVIGTIYYRCNVCSEKLTDFESLNVHAKDRHPNMTLQFEIRKIYKYDGAAKETESTKSCSDTAREGSYQCPRCPVISGSYLDCIDHFNEHYPRYTCGDCSLRFYSVEEVEKHQNDWKHSEPYAMTIPSEKMLEEYKLGITVKQNGVWLPLQENKKSDSTEEVPETKKIKLSLARKSTTQVPERRSHAIEENTINKSKNVSSH